MRDAGERRAILKKMNARELAALRLRLLSARIDAERLLIAVESGTGPVSPATAEAVNRAALAATVIGVNARAALHR